MSTNKFESKLDKKKQLEKKNQKVNLELKW